jgi:hypothetical protein
LATPKISDLNCLSPKGEFSNRLERALDLSKNVLDKAKRDLVNSLSIVDCLFQSTIDNHQ